jgi:3-hydroxyisobutyrate dehydrogenase
MHTVLIAGIQYDLPALEKYCWLKMAQGTLSYKDPFHNPVVANRNMHGVNLRTVVLRKVDAEKKQLSFHTDIRSGKWKELQADNHTSWHFYSPAARIQLRVSGLATLHYDDVIASESWANSTLSSRKIYCGEEGPSALTPIPVSGLPAAFENADPTPEQSEAGRKNFGVVSTRVQWMEWLWLNSAGHRRASFHYNADSSYVANWLVP